MHGPGATDAGKAAGGWEEGAEMTHLYISAGKEGTSVQFILFRKDPVVENERGSAFEGIGLSS